MCSIFSLRQRITQAWLFADDLWTRCNNCQVRHAQKEHQPYHSESENRLLSALLHKLKPVGVASAVIRCFKNEIAADEKVTIKKGVHTADLPDFLPVGIGEEINVRTSLRTRWRNKISCRPRHGNPTFSYLPNRWIKQLLPSFIIRCTI